MYSNFNLPNFNNSPSDTNFPVYFPNFHQHPSFSNIHQPFHPQLNGVQQIYHNQLIQAERARQYEEIIVNNLRKLFQCRQFSDVYRIIKSYNFSIKYHEELQYIWYQAHYQQAELKRKKSLDSVSKHRIKKNNPPPMTIWDGEETKYCFKESSRELLKATFNTSPFPTNSQKQWLSKQTGLQVEQICNWFKNRRQRNKNLKLKRNGTENSIDKEESKADNEPIPRTCESQNSSIDSEFNSEQYQQYDKQCRTLNDPHNHYLSNQMINYYHNGSENHDIDQTSSNFAMMNQYGLYYSNYLHQSPFMNNIPKY